MPLGTLGKYERLDVLGHGVSGIVYLAKDTLLNKQVALKEVDVQAGDMRRFLEEARVMDRLRHPNIVRVNGVDRIEGKIVIDMEYVRGQNLQDLLRTEGTLPLNRALVIAEQTLDALDYAHRMQTVHRDIKPANILISRDGQVKLVDFGLAEILATNAYAGGAGTYAYMAPEDFAEEDRSDHQSDIWAVGVTLFEMLTGQRPFHVTKVKDPFAWKRVLETESPTPLAAYSPGAPAALQAILDRALARDKRRRYQTAGEFRDELLRLRTDLSVRHVAEDWPAANGSEDVANRTQPSDWRRSPSPEAQPALQRTRPIEPLLPRTGPGMAVAGDPAVEETQVTPVRRARLPFLARKPAAAGLIVEPERVDFGMVRKGELRSVKIQARVLGVEGAVRGKVVHTPGWLTVHPAAFDRSRQAITLTAHSGRTWETGEFHETVHVETEAGTVEVPVRLIVLQPRPTFSQIAWWYVPLFISVLLPAVVVALGGYPQTPDARLVPSAAVASGLLALMLLLVGIAAEIGIAERLACGLLMAVMCFVLGVSASMGLHSSAFAGGLEDAAKTAILVGCVLALQILYLPRWKLWGFAIAFVGLAISGTFLHYLR